MWTIFSRLVKYIIAELKIAQSRKDYKKSLKLTMIFFGDKQNNMTIFRTLSAIRHARWVAKAIYCLKIYMFYNEFELSIIEKTAFVVSVYS